MFNRKIIEFGLSPILGYFFLAISFLGGSFFLFYKTELATYLYPIIAINFVFLLSERKRNDFLKINFSTLDYRKLRVGENTLIILPFVLFLFFKNYFFIGLILLFASLIMAFINFRQDFHFTVPTPFYKYPFEFLVGFRRSFLLILGSFLLSIIAISVGNFNLGLFSLIVNFAIAFSYYTYPEIEYYVWVFNVDSSDFLIKKIKIGLLYSSILTLPITIILLLFYYDNWLILLIIQGLGFLYIIAIILLKYTAFPRFINIPQSIIISLTVIFPPLLLAIIPYFYNKAKRNLNRILA